MVEIAGDAQNFHPIAQWLWDTSEGIGSRDEQHLGQVVVDLEIIVVEGGVLFWIEHLQQRCCWIATKILAELIDFVEQNHRIDHFGAPHRLDDSSRH